MFEHIHGNRNARVLFAGYVDSSGKRRGSMYHNAKRKRPVSDVSAYLHAARDTERWWKRGYRSVAIGFNSRRASKAARGPPMIVARGSRNGWFSDDLPGRADPGRPRADVICYGGRHPPICIQCHRSAGIITALTNCRGEGRSR